MNSSLDIRDLTDPCAGPHAVALVADALEQELGRDVPVRRYVGPRIVSVSDNYDRLGYRPDDVTRGRRYTRYLDDDRMLRSHTTAHLPDLLADPSTRAAGDILLSVPGMCYRRDVIDRHHVAEPHQHDLWRVRAGGPPLAEVDLRDMIARVVALVAPGRRWHTPDSPHPYTTGGREIRVDVDGEDIEIGECGLIRPSLLWEAGLGPEASGLAMGLGLDRLVMLVKGIPDVRLLRATDPRIASQMCDLSPYRPVSSRPPVRRDLSIAVDDPDPELLGDRIRERLGAEARVIESIDILAQTPYEQLPASARTRMGMGPGQCNMLLRLVLRDHDHTLTDAQANRVRDLVYAGLHAGRVGEWTAALPIRNARVSRHGH
jgi:phenylalanyl-tRNA synthetase alpha chain